LGTGTFQVSTTSLRKLTVPDTSSNAHPQNSIRAPVLSDPECNNYFKNKDGLWIYTRSWLPKDLSLKALVFLVHGLGEHSNRAGYHDFANILTQAGYGVFSLDHQGHGKSNGYRAHVKTFTDYCADFEQYVEIIKSRYTGLPTFALGHSMGGAILLVSVLRKKIQFNGIILSAPACCAHADPIYSETLRTIGGYIHKVFPKAHLVHIPPEKISRNTIAVKRYQDDPLVNHSLVPASAVAGLQDAGKFLSDNFKDITLPFLVVHGKEDGIVHPDSSKHLYEKASSVDKELKLLDGVYHELWEDQEKGAIFEYLVEWLNAHSVSSPRKTADT